MKNTTLTERLRPKTLDNVVGQDEIVTRLKQYVKDIQGGDSSFPHLLFYGAPGTGKTTCAKAFVREVFGDGYRRYVLDKNASDERGIDFIRGRVKEFARTAPMDKPFNIVFLDECDNLTKDAQEALRRTMEDYAGNCRFILSCNNIKKVHPAIQSRCARFRFNSIRQEDIADLIQRVANEEGMETSAEGVLALARRAKGSMRTAINDLVALGSPITPDRVVDLSAQDGEWGSMIKKAFNGDVLDAEKDMVLAIRSGHDEESIFGGLYDSIVDSKISDAAKNKMLQVLGEYEYRVAVGGSLMVQARCFLRHLAILKSGG